MNGQADEQKQAERLAQVEADLQAAIEELNAFSYSVSHDLRAPLRAIDGFSNILIEDFGASLDDEARLYLDKIHRNAKTMNDMIDALLVLSRLGRQPLVKQRIAPGELAQRTFYELRQAQEGRRVEISVADLPDCDADPALLKHVYDQLIANALKFTRDREVAEIEIGGYSEVGESVYYVRDNGVGFDMRYANKLFGVFQRLHRPDEFKGVGSGLAIVRRVVIRHGGRVWAEAEVNRGAIFYFSLPVF